MSETVIVTGPSSGTPVQPPPSPPSRLDEVKSVLADIEARSGGQAAAPEAPAPEAQPQKPAEPPKVEPPEVEAKPDDKPAPPPAAKEPYSLDELDAFEGNYDRRDFDWERVPDSLRPYAKRLASGTGKYRQRLENEIRAELEAKNGKSQPVPQTPSGNEELSSEQLVEAQEMLVTPGKFFEGFQKLLGTKQGRELLASAGYGDPTERAIVSDLVQGEIINKAIQNVAPHFPQFVSDQDFLQDVTTYIGQDPFLHAKANGRDVREATLALAAASGVVTGQRATQREQAFTAREAAMTTREAAVIAKEQELQKQIEATNRVEPKSPALGGQHSGATQQPQTGVEQARDAMREAGLLA